MPRVSSHPVRYRVALWLVLVLAASGCGNGAGDGASDGGRVTPTPSARIEGFVTLGPRCPVVQVDTPCPDAAAAGVEVTVSQDTSGGSAPGDLVARAVTDAHGRFEVSVPPGSYLVTAVAGMSCPLVPTRPEASGPAFAVVITCDTGIR